MDEIVLKERDQLAQRNLIEAVIDHEYPPCFESKQQYQEWLEAERSAPTVPFRRNICEDCTSTYKSSMILKQRCVNEHLEV